MAKKYDATPLQVLTDKNTRQRVIDLSVASGLSQAEIFRRMLDDALLDWEECYGLGRE